MSSMFIHYYIPLEKDVVLRSKKLKSTLPKIVLCQLNVESGQISKKIDENVRSLRTDGQKTTGLLELSAQAS